MQFDLVFEGGGAKGMVFVGAVEAFEQSGHTAGRLLGTSAGAITATLLAAGYTASEMWEALDEKADGRPVFVGFMGTPGPFRDEDIEASATVEFLRAIDLPYVPEGIEKKVDTALVRLLSQNEKYRHLFSFIELGGWFSADRFLSWMRDKLNAGTWNGRPRAFGGMTLEQFHQATGRELGLVASDTTGQRMLVLNHRTAPDCPVVWAVRMSMSIPLVWQEVEWLPEWGRYTGQDIAGHLIVDGGMLSNFPIELLVSDEPFVTAVMGPAVAGKVIGLLIDDSLPVPDAPPPPETHPRFDFGRLKTIVRLKSLIDTMTNAHDKEVIEALRNLVVHLPAQGYGTTEFDMSPERREALVKAGRAAMTEYLARRQASEALESAALLPAGAGAIAARIAGRILGVGRP